MLLANLYWLITAFESYEIKIIPNISFKGLFSLFSSEQLTALYKDSIESITISARETNQVVKLDRNVKSDPVFQSIRNKSSLSDSVVTDYRSVNSKTLFS